LKDLILGLTIEAGELAECVLWKSHSELQVLRGDECFRQRLGEEVADVFIFLLYICHDLDLDLTTITRRKFELNAQHYPISTSYGSTRKHTT